MVSKGKKKNKMFCPFSNNQWISFPSTLHSSLKPTEARAKSWDRGIVKEYMKEDLNLFGRKGNGENFKRNMILN